MRRGVARMDDAVDTQPPGIPGIPAPAPAPQLSEAQRLILFHGTTLSIDEAFAMDAADVTFDLMVAHGCTFDSIVAANLQAPALCTAGFETPTHFKRVGMDALDLVDIGWTRSLVRLFGANAVRTAFVSTSGDAVAIVGTESARVLAVEIDCALELCAGDPRAAERVLTITPNMPAALAGTTIDRLLDTGMREHSLVRCGVSLGALTKHLKPTGAQLSQLGFSFRV